LAQVAGTFMVWWCVRYPWNFLFSSKIFAISTSLHKLLEIFHNSGKLLKTFPEDSSCAAP